ncbi:MAG: hypothetical protein E7612_11425 [Ruminococcaceae bacterium]|nr:hypothetical protein [Oscillospiraceae bacterium]
MFKADSEIKKKAAFFAIGGIGYGIIELIWRGYTHPTMIIAGGVCFVFFSRIAERYKEKPLVFKAALSALVVTAVELVFGVVFNIIFKMHIWDYSKMPFNLFGQICPLFTLAWGAIAFIFIPIAEVLCRSMARGWIFNRRKTFRV